MYESVKRKIPINLNLNILYKRKSMYIKEEQ